MMLNTSGIEFKHDLNNAHAIVHLLQNSSPLSKCLLLSLAWSLNLSQFLAEAIAYTPHWFAWHFIDQAGDTLKHIDPRKVPAIVDRLVVAIYRNVARSDSRQLDEGERLVTLTRYHDYALELLTTFQTPSEETFAGWSKMKRSKHLGQVVFGLISTISECAAIFRNRNVAFLKSEAEQVFGSVTDPDEVNEMRRDEFGESVYATLNKLNILLLNTLQSNLMLVTVSTFIDWVEFDINDELTLQRQVAEAAHGIEELIKSDNRFAHDVLLQLQSISVRPKTIQDVIRESTLGEIMGKLDSLSLEPDVRQQWLDEFLSRGILVFDNSECLDTLEGNVEHMNLTHVRQLMRGLCELSGTLEDTSTDKLRELVIRTARHFSSTQLHELILHSMEMQPDGVDLELNSLRMSTIQLFNRCSEANMNSVEPLILILQNPLRFFDQMLKTALTADQPQKIICDFINSLPAQMTRSIIQRNILTYVSRCATLTPEETKLLSTLIVRLYNTQYEPVSSFFRQLYQMMAAASRNQDLITVTCLAEALHTIMRRVDESAVTDVAAPLVVMCAVVADHFRWDLVSFADRRVHLVEILVDVIHELRKRLLPVATEADKSFVLQRIAQLKPITRFYFQKLSQPADGPQPGPATFASTIMCPEAIAGVDLTDLPKPELLEKMLSAIVRCTRKECVLLANYELLRPHWFQAITLLSRIVGRTQQSSDQSIGCLRYCAQNLACVIRVSYNLNRVMVQM